MKIFILITRGDSIGGAQVHVKDIAARLQKDGHEVLIGLGGEGAFTALLVQSNLNYVVISGLQREINIFKDIKAFTNICIGLKKFNPDIVATHSSKAGLLGRVASKLFGYPTVFTAHGWSFTEGTNPKKKFLYQSIEKIGALFSNKIIAVSEYDKALYIKNNIGNTSKIVSIQNGMDDIPKILYASAELSPPVIIMVARFQEQKDHKSLILALKKLEALPWKLQLVGEDGGLMDEAKTLVHSLELESRIEFLGQRDDIGNLLKNAQIFVLTSFWEGLPLTIIEAMRAKLPVIASDVGGVNEVVIDNKTGYVIKDFEHLVTSLENLICEPLLREQMGKEGRTYYTNQFTFERMYRETLRVYQEILSIKVK